jgi:hypothetical protein
MNPLLSNINEMGLVNDLNSSFGGRYNRLKTNQSLMTG